MDQFVGSFTKDPDANLDYSIDWTSWLAGDTILTSTWSVESGLSLGTETNTSTLSTVWISGGTIGHSYIAVNRIVTTGGRTDDRSILIMVKQK